MQNGLVFFFSCFYQKKELKFKRSSGGKILKKCGNVWESVKSAETILPFSFSLKSVYASNSDNIKRHFSRLHLNVLNSNSNFILEGAPAKRNALSLKRHLFPHGGRVKIQAQGFFGYIFRRCTPSRRFFKIFELNTKAALLKRHLTLSETFSLYHSFRGESFLLFFSPSTPLLLLHTISLQTFLCKAHLQKECPQNIRKRHRTPNLNWLATIGCVIWHLLKDFSALLWG